MFKVKPEKIKYTDNSKIASDYTVRMNKEYNRMAKIYDTLITIFPLWKQWLKKVIPHIQGATILEVSFGSGYLMSKYASEHYEIHGIDFNDKMVEIARAKMQKLKIDARLIQGNVESLPYPDNMFDTIINTMAFTGYPDGNIAMRELNRVLKPGGKLLLIDFDYPENSNIFGYWCVKLMEIFGDIIKDIHAIIVNNGFDCKTVRIGGFGSVKLFIAVKK